MRFFNGVVVGILLTIGGAYLHDRNVSPSPEGPRQDLVNWEVFGRTADASLDWLKGQFAQLTRREQH